MKTFSLISTILCASMMVCAQSIIYESATLGPVGLGAGSGLALSYHLLGSRFHLDTPVQVDAVGGDIWGSGSLFAAIVSVNGPSALPSGSPFDSTTIATTTFSPPSVAADITIPLSTFLAPGEYALIFGSQHFGATGSGVMPFSNYDLPGSIPYIDWDYTVQQWANMTGTHVDGLRFVVYGDVVPEPNVGALLAMGIAALLTRRQVHIMSTYNR